MKVEFAGIDFELGFQKYGNGRTALTLAMPEDENDYLVATINVPGAELKENQVLIKDYSENEGVLDALEKAGVVRRTGETVQSGWVEIPVCELLVEAPGKDRPREEAVPPQRNLERDR